VKTAAREITQPAPAHDAPAVIHLPHLPPPTDAPAKKRPKRQKSRFVGIRFDDAGFAEAQPGRRCRP
jgi:hypothetical protein